MEGSVRFLISLQPWSKTDQHSFCNKGLETFFVILNSNVFVQQNVNLETDAKYITRNEVCGALKSTDANIGTKFLLRLMEQGKNDLYYDLLAKLLTKMLLTCTSRAFYPMDAICNGSLRLLRTAECRICGFVPQVCTTSILVRECQEKEIRNVRGDERKYTKKRFFVFSFLLSFPSFLLYLPAVSSLQREKISPSFQHT